MLTAGETRTLGAAVLRRAGVPEAEAWEVAGVLTWADVHGVHSHGMMRLPHYRRRLLAGGIAADAPLEQLAASGSLTRYDGHNGMGHWQVWRAAGAAAERARQDGVHLAGIMRSSHCGALGALVWPMLARGCVGFLLSNGPAAVAPWGTGTPLLSTGPLAVGVPGEGGSIVVDLATTASARGRVLQARDRGEQLPEGIAVDGSGQPTVDPAAALLGSLAPIGGHKGFAIGMAFEALTGGLFGDRLSTEVVDMFDPQQDARPQGISHFILAIDPVEAGGGLTAGVASLTAAVEAAGGRVPGWTKRHPDEIDPDVIALDDPVLEKRLQEFAD